MIQLLLKDFFKLTSISKSERKNKLDVYNLSKGFYKRNIGIISYSKIGQAVINNLKCLSDNNIYVYDPFYDEDYFRKEGVIKAELNEIFEKCDVVSLHTP